MAESMRPVDFPPSLHDSSAMDRNAMIAVLGAVGALAGCNSYPDTFETICVQQAELAPSPKVSGEIISTGRGARVSAA